MQIIAQFQVDAVKRITRHGIHNVCVEILLTSFKEAHHNHAALITINVFRVKLDGRCKKQHLLRILPAVLYHLDGKDVDSLRPGFNQNIAGRNYHQDAESLNGGLDKGSSM